MANRILSKVYIGKRIKILRETENLDKRKLGALLRVSAKTISLWESGKNIPSLQNMVNICNLFRVSLDSFVLTSR